MMIAQYKKVLLFCLAFISSSIFSMQEDQMKKNLQDIKSALKNKSSSLETIATQAEDLAQKADDGTYRRLTLMFHPDKVNNDPQLVEIFKRISNIKDKSKPKAVHESDLNTINGQIQQYKDDIAFVQEYPISTMTTLQGMQQARSGLSRHVTSKNIDRAFDLLSGKLLPAYTKNNELKEDVNSLHTYQEKLTIALQMHSDYHNDLQQSTTRISQRSQNLLKKHFKRTK